MLKKLSLICLALLFFSGVVMAKQENPIVQLQTNIGDIFIELLPEKAPISCKNFLEYATGNFYENTIFHRVVPGFVIQGGGYISGLKNKQTLTPIKNEANNGLSNARGTIAMARTQSVDSATSQFFINVADNPNLNHKNTTKYGYGYAVFGKVIKGMEIVDKINATKTTNIGPFRHVPVEDVVINKVIILRKLALR